uniref:Uncharacterized protein n=1 Tax=Ditylenchus dipsaci TaxID=166011 RepID=A0A915EIB1_9BILA
MQTQKNIKCPSVMARVKTDAQTQGIICRAKRCDTKRYRHQYLPFQLAYAYNSLGDCAFEYGETVKGKSKRKGGFGIRMLCLSKNTMSEELYTVGKSCSACKKKCDSDGLCDGDSISSPKSAKTSSKTKSKSKSKPKKGPSTGNSPLASMKDSSSMQVEDKLGDLCEVSDIKGEAVVKTAIK